MTASQHCLSSQSCSAWPLQRGVDTILYLAGSDFETGTLDQSASNSTLLLTENDCKKAGSDRGPKSTQNQIRQPQAAQLPICRVGSAYQLILEPQTSSSSTQRSSKVKPLKGSDTYALNKGYAIHKARTLLGAPGLITRSKDATRGSWPCY